MYVRLERQIGDFFCHSEVEDLVDLHKVKKMDQSATQMAQRHQNERNLQTQLFESISFGVRSATKEASIANCQEFTPSSELVQTRNRKEMRNIDGENRLWNGITFKRMVDGKIRTILWCQKRNGPWTTSNRLGGYQGKIHNVRDIAVAPQSTRLYTQLDCGKSLCWSLETCDTKHDWKDKFMQCMRLFALWSGKIGWFEGQRVNESKEWVPL